MIIGAHSILYSKMPQLDRHFLRDVLGFPSVDAGDGWLIFGLPPSEVAVHPSEKNDVHEFYLMCDDVAALVADLTRRNVACSPVRDQGWGLLTQVSLPGGGKLGIYEPRHARPKAMGGAKTATGRARRATAKKRTTAKKTVRARKPAARPRARARAAKRKR